VTAARRTLLIWLGACVLLVACWGLLHVSLFATDQMTDDPVYAHYGDLTVAGKLPYRDFHVDYPPGALPLFVLPSLGYHGRIARLHPPSPPRTEYRRRFAGLVLACALVALTAMAWTLAALGASLRRQALALGAFALAPLLLGASLVFGHFDYWPAALCAVAVAATLARRRGWGALALGAAIAVKVYPVVLAPLFVADAWHHGGRRAAGRCAGLILGSVTAIVLPFLVLAPHGVWSTFQRQLGRPLQIESLGSTALLMAHSVFGLHVSVTTGSGSQNLDSSASGTVAALTGLLAIGALGWVWQRFARTADAGGEELVRCAAAAVTAFVAFGKVLSPQYLVWLVALVPLVRGRRGLLAATLLGGALGLTAIWFPSLYFNWVYDIEAHPEISLLVFERDLLLAAVFLVLVWPTGRRAAPGTE
jgi:Glycosyltransferase family 87